MNTPTILQLVLIDETGDSYYRMRWPGMQLVQQNPNWRVINLDAKAKERFSWAEEADLLVLYQSNDIDLIPVIKKRKAQGKKTLVEYNDNFYSPPPASPVAKEWSSPLLWQTYERLMEVSDGVIVTGAGLRELFSKRAKKNIFILENHFPRELPPFEEAWVSPLRKSSSDPSLNQKICLGWGGSLGHIADFLAVLPTIRELMAETTQLQFHVMGNDAIKDMLQLPPDRVFYVPWGSIEEYYQFWKPVHLGIAPLLDTPYNRCRSDIKAIEMGSLAVLPVLPDALPYQIFLEETQQKPFRTFQELKKQIRFYVDNPEQIFPHVQRCYAYVRQSRIGLHRLERCQLYSQFLLPTSSTFHWPFPHGYHEIRGVSEKKTRYHQTLVKVQQLIDARQMPKARAFLTGAILENPENPELALAELKCLAAERDPRVRDEKILGEKLEDYKKMFPADLRFRFFQIRCTKDFPIRLLLWRDTVEKLLSESPPYRNFFGGELIALFCQDFRQRPDFLPLAEELVRLYPNAADLRFEMAEHYERIGDYRQSNEHFQWLVEAGNAFVQNQAFLSGTQLNYLLTWQETLGARLRGF